MGGGPPGAEARRANAIIRTQHSGPGAPLDEALRARRRPRQAPTKTGNVPPVYPAIAQAARVEGLVILAASIGADGRVDDTRLVHSIPLLDQAAIDAVRQWEFTPTLLNGVPVPVIMTVTVGFVLEKDIPAPAGAGLAPAVPK